MAARANFSRPERDLDALGEIGRTAEAGLSGPSGGDADARRWLERTGSGRGWTWADEHGERGANILLHAPLALAG